MTSANSVALPLSLCFEYNYASFGSEALQRPPKQPSPSFSDLSNTLLLVA